MRLNVANRSFFGLVGTALVPYVLLGLFGCGLLSVLVHRLWTDGYGGLVDDGRDLRPAALFSAIVAAGTLLGLRSLRKQLLATRVLARDVASRRIPIDGVIADAAERAGLSGRLDVVRDAQPYSFTYGVAESRVVVSTGLVAAVSVDELDAVLHHELYHVRNGDPVKVVVARAAPEAFFFLPALGHLRDRYLAGRELAADRASVLAGGDGPLAGALLKILDGPTWVDLGATAALGGGILEHRVAQLESGVEPRLAPVPNRALWVTTAGVAALVGLFGLTIAGAGADVLAMEGSTPSGLGATVLGLAASAVCMTGMVALVASAVRRGARHRRGGLTTRY